jgi:hypothetical protein
MSTSGSPITGSEGGCEAGRFKHGMMALTLKAKRVIELAFTVRPRQEEHPPVAKPEEARRRR